MNKDGFIDNEQKSNTFSTGQEGPIGTEFRTRKVILLVMSTLPPSASVNIYQYCGDRYLNDIEKISKEESNLFNKVKNGLGEQIDKIECDDYYSVDPAQIGLRASDFELESMNSDAIDFFVRVSINKKTEEKVLSEIKYVIGDTTRIIGNDSVSYDSRRETYKGISQLEAGTKHFIYEAALGGSAIDKIVVLASSETRKENETYKTQKGEYLSAVDLYTKRIKSYISGEEGFVLERIIDQHPDICEDEFKGKNLYSNIDSLIKIIPDNDATSNNMQRLWEAAKEIRGDLQEGDKVDLYIDMQGGLRHDYPAINTIISLLTDQEVKVEIKERVATEYHFKNIVQPTFEVTKDYEYYDLITAYQIFKNYGWGNELKRYFQNGSEPDRKIAEAITKISDAIILCNVDGFDEGIESLKQAIITRNTKPDQSTEMDFIITEIEKDFDELLKDYSKPLHPMRYVNEIEWCLKKNFIQQAVTIFEAKMPTEYVWNGLCYYCKDRSSRMDFVKKAIELYEWYKNNDESNRYRLLDFNHYWIRTWVRESTKKKGTSSVPKKKRISSVPEELRNKFEINWSDGISKEDIISSIDKYEELCKARNKINHAKGKSFFVDSLRKKFREDKILKTNESDIKSEINNFLVKFKELANKVSAKEKELIVDINIDYEESKEEEQCSIFDFKGEKIGRNKNNKERLEGILSNGEKAIVPFRGRDLSMYIGKTVTVRVVNNHKGKGTKECDLCEEDIYTKHENE